jgi:hypothetical protein
LARHPEAPPDAEAISTANEARASADDTREWSTSLMTWNTERED